MKILIYQLKNHTRIIIWAVIYMIYVYSTYDLSVVTLQGNFSVFIEGNLLNAQKFLFDVSIFYVSYLFVVKKPFVSTFYISRCRNIFLLNVILYGIKISIIYIFYTLCLFLGFPLLFGLPIVIDTYLIFGILNLLTFLFSTYLIYLFILIITSKQMFSLLSVFSLSLVLLIFYHSTGLINQEFSIMLENLILTVYPGVSLIMILANVIAFHRREFFI